MIKDQVINRWTGQKASDDSYPKRYGPWPDADHKDIIRRLCGDGKIVEVGCGNGRLASLFDPDKYIGVDINPAALADAAKANPNHVFEQIDYDDKYPDGDTYLLHTVLMHVPDKFVQSVLVRCQPRVVIFECMQEEFSKPHRFNWHRSPDWYNYALHKAAFEVVTLEKYPTNYQPHSVRKRVRHFMVGEAVDHEL